MRESRLPTETRFRGTFLELKVENAIELLLCNLCSALGVAIERVDVRLIGCVKAAWQSDTEGSLVRLLHFVYILIFVWQCENALHLVHHDGVIFLGTAV